MGRTISDLHPVLQKKITELKALCAKNGLAIGISECFRTAAEQDALYAQGRTCPGSVVTNAPGSTYSSQHQWGIAFDFYLDMDIDGDGQKSDDAFNNSTQLFEKVGALAKSIGLGWGGDWISLKDRPHLYLPDWGSTTKLLRAQYGTFEAFQKTWGITNTVTGSTVPNSDATNSTAADSGVTDSTVPNSDATNSIAADSGVTDSAVTGFAITGTVITRKDPLIIRSRPDISSTPLGRIPKGAAVTILQPGTDWHRVAYQDCTGYCSAKYIAIPNHTPHHIPNTIPNKECGAKNYTVGQVYTLQTELNVRTQAGTQYRAKKHSELTSGGKAADRDKDGALDKGTRVTCLEIRNIGNDVWIRIPSGWIAAVYNGNIYVK